MSYINMSFQKDKWYAPFHISKSQGVRRPQALVSHGIDKITDPYEGPHFGVGTYKGFDDKNKCMFEYHGAAGYPDNINLQQTAWGIK
jgi:hypothetical protein